MQKLKKNSFFTLEDLSSSGILLLDSQYFFFLKIKIIHNNDNRSRNMEIETLIQENFQNYDKNEYIKKEIILDKDENYETLLIILLNELQIESVLFDLEEKEIKISGILPLFILGACNRNSIKKTYLEIEDETIYLFYFKDNKLYDFDETSIHNLELKDEEYMFSFYNYELENVHIHDYKEYNVHYLKEIDFLPKRYQEKNKNRKLIKWLGSIFVFTLLIETIFYFSSSFYIDSKCSEIQDMQNTIHAMNLDITKKRENITNLLEEENIFNNQNIKLKNRKISDFIKFLIKHGETIQINSIQYNIENLTITGFTNKKENLINFEKYIFSNDVVKNLIHDSIIFKENRYYFNLELKI